MNRKKGAQPSLPQGYTPRGKLGESTATVVWSVTHEATDKRQALKITNAPDPAHRLQREFAILKRFELSGLVRVDEFGEHEGREYFTMELVESKPFTCFMRERREDEDFLDLFLSVLHKAATTLSALHRQGIVHIDVKPSNFVVTDNGEPVLLDFGFAEDFILSPTAEPSGTTLDYAAPELFTGGSVSPAADVYSLGAIAYEVLKGRKLWEGLKPRELIAAKLKTPPGFGKVEFDIPPGLDTLVLRMLSPDPGLRPSAVEVLAELSWMTAGEEMNISTPVMVPQLVFGGRDTEIAEIERLVFDEDKVVLLNGKSGLGKTRLLRELRFKALLDNRQVLYIERRGAYLSLVEYLAASLGIKEEMKEDTDKERLPDKWSRYEWIFQAMDKAGFDGVFIDAPVDLNEDEAGLLGYLARGFDGKKGILLSQVSEKIHPEAAEVRLAPLDGVKVASLVSRTFGNLKRKKELMNTLVSVADGNPRMMNALLDLLHAEGWLRWKRGWVYEPGKEEEGLVGRLEGWLGESIGRLGDGPKLALSLLAVSESALPVEVFSRTLGDDASLVLQSLVNESLVRSFLYLERPHYEFANDVIKPYLLGKLTKAKRKALSCRLAEPLEKFLLNLGGEDSVGWDTTYLAQVGLLYFEAGVKSKAPGYLVAAGRRLTSLGNSERAKQLLSLALLGEPGAEEKKTALCELGRIAHYEHDADQAEEFYSQALPLFADRSEEKAKVFLRIGRAFQRVQALDKALVFFERSEECLSDPPERLRSQQLYARGWNTLLRGKLEDAVNFFKGAIGGASTPDELGHIYAGLAAALLRKGKASQALGNIRKAVKLAEASDVKAFVILYMVDILISLGEFSAIDEYLRRALSITKEIKFPSLAAEVMSSKVRFLYNAGRYRKACSLAAQAIRVSKKINDRYRIFSLTWAKAYCLIALGDWESAQNIYFDLWKKSHNTSRNWKNLTLMDWAVLCRVKGRFHAASRMLNKAKTIVGLDNNNRELLNR